MGDIAFSCAACGSRYRIPADKIPPGGAKAPCKQCGAPLTVFPDGRLAGAVTIAESPQPSPAATMGAPPSQAPPPPAPSGPFVFRCPQCRTEHRVDLSTVPPQGVQGACVSCKAPLLLLADGTVKGPELPAAPPEAAEVGDMSRWEIHFEDQVLGPFPVDQIKELIYAGRLPADRAVRPVGGEWAAAASFAALATLFSPEEREADSGPIGDRDHCFAHPDRPPVRNCSQCQRYLCEECLKRHQSAGTLKPILLCNACGGTTVEVRRKPRWTPFYRDMGKVLAAPVQGFALFYTALITLMQVMKIPSSAGGPWGLAAVFILTCFQLTFYLHIVREVAGGSYDFPEWPDVTHFGDMVMGFLKVLFVAIVSLLPMLLLGCLGGGGIGAAAGILGGGDPATTAETLGLPIFVLSMAMGVFYAAYLPICVCIVAIFNSVIPALNPWIIIKIIMRIGPTYFLAVALWIALLVIESAAGGLAIKAGLLGGLLIAPLEVYTNLVSAYILGRVICENEDKIGWY